MVLGIVSARALEPLSRGRETILRSAAPAADGPSSSVSESKAEISTDCSGKGERKGGAAGGLFRGPTVVAGEGSNRGASRADWPGRGAEALRRFTKSRPGGQKLPPAPLGEVDFLSEGVRVEGPFDFGI
jgi:hypothetical protein